MKMVNCLQISTVLSIDGRINLSDIEYYRVNNVRQIEIQKLSH
jgi:hypothetical protein